MTNSEKCKRWQLDHPEEFRESLYKWREKNKEKFNEYQRTYMKQYYQKNREKYNKYQRNYQKQRRNKKILEELNIQ
jgi:hypothetical protein